MVQNGLIVSSVLSQIVCITKRVFLTAASAAAVVAAEKAHGNFTIGHPKKVTYFPDVYFKLLTRLTSSLLVLQEKTTIMDKIEGRLVKRPRSEGEKNRPRTAEDIRRKGRLLSAPEKTLQVVKEPVPGVLSEVSSSTGTSYDLKEEIRISNSRGKSPRNNYPADSKPGSSRGWDYFKLFIYFLYLFIRFIYRFGLAFCT